MSTKSIWSVKVQDLDQMMLSSSNLLIVLFFQPKVHFPKSDTLTIPYERLPRARNSNSNYIQILMKVLYIILRTL